MDEQLLRLTLPTSLLVQVDDHIASEGSIRTRSDFVREAIEQRLLELRFAGDASTRAFGENESRDFAPTVDRALLPQSPLASEDADLSDDPLATPKSLADTRLPTPSAATFAEPGDTALSVEPGPFFLHGRDYPSLWALYWLTRWADEGPIVLDDYLERVANTVHRFASHLPEQDRSGGLKAATMFPTSSRNPGSSRETFLAAAVGGVVSRRDGSQVAVGPLALWRVAVPYRLNGAIVVAPTQAGLNLLTHLEGLSLELPHTDDQTRIFLDHLREHAPTDHQTFVAALTAIAEKPRRDDLISRMSAAEIPSSTNLADVYAQAYVSRAREWGLVEPRLIDRRYQLTDSGSALLGDA